MSERVTKAEFRRLFFGRDGDPWADRRLLGRGYFFWVLVRENEEWARARGCLDETFSPVPTRQQFEGLWRTYQREAGWHPVAPAASEARGVWQVSPL